MAEEITHPQEISKDTSIEAHAAEKARRRTIALLVIIVVIIIAGIIVGAIFLLSPGNKDATSQIRDVFIIFMALETLVVGVALVILIIQLAILTNLLQNEVKPILDSTSEAVNTLKGTIRFVSDNLTEPVIKLNEKLAMGKRIIGLLKPRK
ncbi:MAG: hypothetical protein ABIG43_06515 [Chloroflexota bacterium]